MRSTCSRLESSASKMAIFNPKAFEKKLKEMDLSQTSVQTVSLWIIHHKQSIKEILSVWIEQIKKVKPDRKIVLFYLANDVVQNCRKKSRELILFFGKAFREILPYLNDKKINGQVERVFKIWEERRVYDKDYLEKFRSLHSTGRKEKVKNGDDKKEKSSKPADKLVEKTTKTKVASKPLPHDFKMSTVMNMIVSMKELESEISKQESQMASLRVDASDLEAVKQVKDRSGVNKFVKEFEESKEKLDLHCNTMSRSINDKRALIDMLHHSESYYDAAYEEAKVIVHAYKTFGSRLSSMKRKVESRVKKLESAWKKKQKEIEEKKASQPEYELEPISDAEEPNEFQPIGDLVQSGLDSLSKRKKAKSELYNPEDPTCDNVNVLDMDLESDSDEETPNGPLYDPSSVLYDPSEAADNCQTGVAESQQGAPLQINIPNPEDIFKNLVSQSDAPSSQFPSSANQANEMSSMPSYSQLGNTSASIFSSGHNLKGNVPSGLTKDIACSSEHTKLGEAKASNSSSSVLVATEPSRNLLCDAAMSPISDDSCPSPSPEGTPDGLVLENEPPVSLTSLAPMFTMQNDAFPNALPNTPLLPPVDGQFQSGEQLLPMSSESWPNVNSSQQLQFDQVQNLSNIHVQSGNITGWSSIPGNVQLQDLQASSSLSSTLNLGMPFHMISASTDMTVSGQFLNQNIIQSNESMMQPGMNAQQGLLPAQQQVLATTIDSSTPTQDESLEKGVRPADILSNLLNKNRKHKHDSSLSPDDVDHGKRAHRSSRKSSSKKRKSSHRHHSSRHRESSQERGSSTHSSSRSKDKSSRRRSRSRSIGVSLDDAGQLESSGELLRAEDSVSNFQSDPFDDSLSKSPKSAPFSSVNEGGSVEEKVKEDRTIDQETSHIQNAERRHPTIFDMRRNNTTEADKANAYQLDKQEVSSGITDSENDATFKQLSSTLSSVTGANQINASNKSETLGTSESTSNSQQEIPGYFYNARRSPTPEMDRFEQPPLDSNNLPQPPLGQTAISQPGQIGSSLPIPQFALDFQQDIQKGLFPVSAGNQDFQPPNFEQQQIMPVQNLPVHPDQSLLGQYQPPLQQGGVMLTPVRPEGLLPLAQQPIVHPERPQFQVGQQALMPDQNLVSQEESKPFDIDFQRDSELHADNSFVVRPDRPISQQAEPVFNQSRPLLHEERHRPPFRPECPLFRSQRPPFRQQRPRFHDETKHGGQHEGIIGSPRFEKPRSLNDFNSQRNSFDEDAHNFESDMNHDMNFERLNNHISNHQQFDYNDVHMNNFDEDDSINGIPSPRGSVIRGRHPRPGHFQHGYPRGVPMRRGRFRNPEPNNAPWGNRSRYPRMGAPGNFPSRPRFRPPLRPRLPQGFAPRRPVF